MGCTIEGQRLGLGTNLFSTMPTLMEKMGYTKLCAELSKKSEFYSQNFYGNIKDQEETSPAPSTAG